MALAGDQDFILLSRPRVPRFEAYLSQTLQLGAPRVLAVPYRRDPGYSLAGACRKHAPSLAVLVAAARSAGGLNIVPYIACGNVWQLAAAIAREADVPVRVTGAPPRISRLANDKSWFTQCIQELLGAQALPPTFTTFGPSALAGRLRYLAERHARVVLKTPSSAGSMGNLVFDSADILGKPLADLRTQVLEALQTIGCHDRYPILVGVWEHPVICSPSAQLWVPAMRDGPPILEGIFVQSIQGTTSKFIGAEPAVLPAPINSRFAREALMLATLLQKLGYFGRVSFDALLLGNDMDCAVLHWIECNGRWGGTSIPMSVAHRLGVRQDKVSIVIVQKPYRSGAGTNFYEVLHCCRDELYEPGRHPQGAVLLLPPGPDETNLTFLVLAASSKEANAIASTVCGHIDRL